METRRIDILSGDLKLEGVAHVPRGEALGAAVVCHPHPLYGGDMENHVVVATAQALAGAGVLAVRFNFRGTGASGGSHERGVGEQEDVLAAAAKARELAAVPSLPLGLAGYSFGAAVAAMAAQRLPGLRALALISPPMGMLDVQILLPLDVPILILTGEGDQFAPPQKLQEWTLALGERCELVVVPGADHFWWTGFATPAARVAAFMRRHLAGHERP